MTKSRIVAAAVSISIFLTGCAAKRINFEPKPNDPIYAEKKEFYDNYFRLITLMEGEQFVLLATIDEFRKFEDEFWKKRDINPNTPENEYKDKIDSRLQDIENEILFNDIDTTGTRFDTNGGLKGEIARVYLLYGMPSFKAKLPEGDRHVELMVWYYIDYRNRPLMRFLFYENNGRMKLFKNHLTFVSEEYLFDPHFSPLREISNRPGLTTPEELYYLWNEVVSKDIPIFLEGYRELVFTSAFFEFSYYTQLDKHTRWTIDTALLPPEPAALTAAKLKPSVVGQPNIPEGTKLLESGFKSLLPAYLRKNAGPENPTFLMITILRKNLDWINQENEVKPYITNLNLRVSFQNKKTRELAEFVSYFRFELSQTEFDKKDDKGELIGSLVIFPNTLQYFDGVKSGPTMGEMLKQLEPGEYVVNIYLQHTVTKKNNSWREEIVVK